MNGEVFIVALIDLVRPLTNQVLDTVPRPAKNCEMIPSFITRF